MAEAVDEASVPSMLNMKDFFELIINTLDEHSFFKHTLSK